MAELMPWVRRWLQVLAGALSASVVLAGCGGGDQPVARTASGAGLETLTVSVTSADGERLFDGLVEAIQQATLVAQTSGRVVAIERDVDDVVARGTLILTDKYSDKKTYQFKNRDDKKRTVIVDLGGATLTAGWGTGSHQELMSLYSLVHTLTANFADARRVRVLINGTPAETLAGHISLTKSLEPFPGLVEPSAR